MNRIKMLHLSCPINIYNHADRLIYFIHIYPVDPVNLVEFVCCHRTIRF